jgi:hypothetical protein
MICTLRRRPRRWLVLRAVPLRFIVDWTYVRIERVEILVELVFDLRNTVEFIFSFQKLGHLHNTQAPFPHI